MKIAVLEITQDRRIRKKNKNTFVEWIYDENAQVVWFILRRLFAAGKYFKGQEGMVIDNGYSVPLNPYNDYKEEEIKALTDLDARASQALNVAEAQAEKENRQNILARTVALVIGAIFLMVMVLVILVAAGRIG